MNIAPLNSINIKPMYFKGNDKKLPQENNPNESLQNNSPDISFPPELYINSMINKSMAALEKTGYFEKLFSDEENVDFDDFSVSSSDMTLLSLKSSALMLGLPPEDIKKEIPVFVKLDFKSYMDAFAKRIERIKEDLAEYNLQDIATSMMLGGADEEEIEDIQSLLSESDDDSAAIIESMENNFHNLLSRPNDVQEALDLISEAQNYRIYKTLINGFEGNSKNIIDTISNGLTLSNCTDIEHNDDGTVTYNYSGFVVTCKVVRDEKNLDYISCEISQPASDNSKTRVEFNKDGSIKEMVLPSLEDGSKVIINQDKKTNTARVRQIFDTWVSDRTFVNLNGKLKQTSCKLYVRQ